MQAVTIHKPVHIIRFSGGAVEFIPSETLPKILKTLNEERVIDFSGKIYACRLFETAEQYNPVDGIAAIIATCPAQYRRRLNAEIGKYKEATGKDMPAHTTQCHLAAWEKENSPE
jgi:hypothetical protein